MNTQCHMKYIKESNKKIIIKYFIENFNFKPFPIFYASMRIVKSHHTIITKINDIYSQSKFVFSLSYNSVKKVV